MSRFALLLALLLGGASTSGSTEGEAAMYVRGDFSGGFSVAYSALLQPTPSNRSRVFVGIRLRGTANTGPSIEVGLTRGVPNAQDLAVFTAIVSGSGGNRYQSFPVSCAPSCRLILRADARHVRALVITRNEIEEVGTWARSDFPLVRPYLQLDAAVPKPGDAIAASLVPMRVVAASQTLPAPTCGFTTRGILPERLAGGTLSFTGTNRDKAPASLIDLRSRRFVDRCRE